MKKIIIVLLLIFTLIGCSSENLENVNNLNEQLNIIYTSNYTLYDLTKKIVGEEIEVIDITSNSKFHGWEPTARDIANLQNGDLFIYSGNNIEVWAENLIRDNIVTGNILSASDGIDLLYSDHTHGKKDEGYDNNHEFSQFDPHYWLSLRNGQIILENIKNKLIELNPENKDYFEKNYKKYSEDFSKLDEKYSLLFSNTKRDTIIVSHEAYGYLARDYDFNQVGIEGINAQGEPSIKQIDEIIKTSRNIDANVIFYEHTINPKVAEMIANELGIDLIKLNPLESLTDEEIENNDDYLSIMEKNLRGINTGLNE